MQYPDSPEGVALALLTLVIGNTGLPNQREPIPKEEIFQLYRECIATVREEPRFPLSDYSVAWRH